MYLVLNKDDFRKNQMGMSLFYSILHNLQVPIEKRDTINEVEVQVESFEITREIK